MFSYEIRHKGSILEADNGFEDEEEALQDAQDRVNEILRVWKSNGYYNNETEEDFYISVDEY